jgi:hypothetical protein
LNKWYTSESRDKVTAHNAFISFGRPGGKVRPHIVLKPFFKVFRKCILVRLYKDSCIHLVDKFSHLLFGFTFRRSGSYPLLLSFAGRLR